MLFKIIFEQDDSSKKPAQFKIGQHHQQVTIKDYLIQMLNTYTKWRRKRGT